MQEPRRRDTFSFIHTCATRSTQIESPNVDGLVACFSEGARYTDTFFGAHTGHPTVRAMFGREYLDEGCALLQLGFEPEAVSAAQS